MTVWNNDVLSDIATAAYLYVSPLRRDGTTYRTATQIWSVVVGDELYARAYNGPDARWYTVALAQGRGRIRAGGHELEVTFEPATEAIRGDVDRAYREKYGDSAYLDPMIAPAAQAATVRITPAGS